MLRYLLICAILCILTSPAAGAEPFETDLFIAGEDNIAHYRIPALTVTKSGALIAVCDGRVTRLDDAPNNIDMVMKRSTDGGRTWSSLKTIIDYPGEEAAGDPCIFTDRMTGAIWVFYDYAVPKEGLLRNRDLWLHAVRSDDEGETWSAPVNLSASLADPGWLYLAAAPGTAIQSRSGRLVVPVYSVRSKGDEYASHTAYSDDHGKTWKLGGETGKSQCEPQVAELADGTLIMNMRQTAGNKCRGVAKSSDGGETWTAVADDRTLIESECQASFIAHKNMLLFSNPAHDSKRVDMTIRLSSDGGKTWPVSKLIHRGPTAYSCMAVLPDGSVGILYERGDRSPYEKITFARFDIDWLTGKDARR